MSKASEQRELKAQAEALRKTFDSIGENIIDELTVALEEAGVTVKGSAKYYAPVDLGLLRNSITHRQGKDPGGTRFVEIGTNVEYAPYVEFGTGIYAEDGKGRKTGWAYEDPKTGEMVFTRGNRPTKFLRTAFEKHKSAIAYRIRQAVKKGAEEKNGPS